MFNSQLIDPIYPIHFNYNWPAPLSYNYFDYYTSREDSWFWLVKGHGLIVMFSSLLMHQSIESPGGGPGWGGGGIVHDLLHYFA